MIRPALALLACEAVGGRAESAVPAGVAVELVHNFSLLHDDVMDGDRERRHRRTVWAVFGIPRAVLAGDALWALALRVLADAGPPGDGEGLRMLVGALGRLMDGQIADVDFPRRTAVSLAACEAMAAGKTGALMGCACALGALLGGGSLAQVEGFRGFGEHLGLAFQLVDDLLGIWGDPAITGKPTGSDLTNRKKTLPVVAALHSATPAATELAELYRRPRPLTDPELRQAANLVEQAGGRAWARQQITWHLTHAQELLHHATPACAAAENLSALATLIVDRDH